MARALQVVLADICYTNRLNRHSLHVPKNIGYVGSYLQRHLAPEVELRLFKDPQNLLDGLGDTPPDVLGLSFYAWNTNLNHVVTQIVRERWGSKPVIVWGGPSVDTDPAEQERLFQRFPEVDAFIPNEGELGFLALVRRVLEGRAHPLDDPMDGVVHKAGGVLVRGRDVGLSLDLAELPSPYLNGLLDPFLHGELLPGIQTSRLCPYTCAFCVSGKNVGKLRGFPLDQVKDEIDFICKTFADRAHMTMHINDENFGILNRDSEIAEHIIRAREKFGYPQSIFFYHDKRLTETTKKVLLSLSTISQNGVTIPLQSENREALKAVKRKPVNESQIIDTIAWAADHDLAATTEMIFGLPGETGASFIKSLDTAITRGFDSVLCNTLFIVDGIEIGRQADRERQQLVTRFRTVQDNYGMMEGRFCAEVEEVVVASRTFGLSDFLDVRKIGMMFYAIFNMRFNYWLISHYKLCGLPVSSLMREFLSSEGCGQERLDFVRDLEAAITAELNDSPEELRRKLAAEYAANGNDVGAAMQINIRFGARIIYTEGDWVDPTLLGLAVGKLDESAMETARFLAELYRRERVNVLSGSVPQPIETQWDVLKWRAEKFCKPLSDYRFERPRRIEFHPNPVFQRMFQRLCETAEMGHNLDAYCVLLQTITPRTNLMFDLAYSAD